ncbi:MAG TPA: hypothetical protein VHZ97_27950 [Pseudonocardiaceae bacterium]|nr:hypothetical protein [Pseudonocardiaceae bacterium]
MGNQLVVSAEIGAAVGVDRCGPPIANGMLDPLGDGERGQGVESAVGKVIKEQLRAVETGDGPGAVRAVLVDDAGVSLVPGGPTVADGPTAC